MSIDSTLTIGTEKAIRLLIELLGVAVAIFSVVTFFSKRTAKRFGAKADKETVETLDKKVDKLECEISDKIRQFVSDNLRSHVEIKADITMQETRNMTQHAEIREDYRIGIEQLQTLIRDRFDDLRDLIKETRNNGSSPKR